MINVRFEMENGHIRSFKFSGHSFYAESGSDVICSAVTSAVRYFECAVNDILGASLPFTVDEKGTVIESRDIPCSDSEQDRFAQLMLTALFTYLSELQSEYPDYIQISKT